MSMPPVQEDHPDAGYADAVFTVLTQRAVVLSGLAAGALVLCVPLAILGFIGLIATTLFNRGTIDAGTSFTLASGKIETALLAFALVLIGSSILGAVLGAVRRWSVRRGITWKLLVGNHFSSHPGPQTVISLLTVPLLIVGILHAVSTMVENLVSIAPVLFFMFPLWGLSGFLYEAAWEPLLLFVLRSVAAEPMKLLKREATLVSLLKDDAELFDCRLQAVRIDSENGVAHIRGDFRTPDHFRRVREIGLRVIGVNDVEVEGLTSVRP